VRDRRTAEQILIAIGEEHPQTVEEATRAVEAAAARLGVTLNDHVAVMQRTRAAVDRLNGKLEAARRNGNLQLFNRAYHAYRLGCQQRGEHAMAEKEIDALSRVIVEVEQQRDDALAERTSLHPATRNTCVYTPMSAILHHAGVEIKLRRPKGSEGRVVTDWLRPPDAFGIITAAESFDVELAVLLMLLLYTGIRLGAALNLQRNDIRISDSVAWVKHEKGQPASDVRLRDDLRDALARHLHSHNHERVFRFHQGGHLKYQLVRAKLGYLGLSCPARRPKRWHPPPNRLAWTNFHSFRHTWATWMRQAGTDVQGLVATGNWRSMKSAARYAHAVAREEWSRVDLLPSRGKTREMGNR
jgi:integrase